LQHNRIAVASVSAVATVGGGARIPLITQRLSEHLRAPVVTTPHPQLTAAEGASLIAYRSQVAEVATTMAPSVGTAVATGGTSTGFRALAWSEEEATDAYDPEATQPYLGDDYDERATGTRPELRFHHDESAEEQHPPRRTPLLLFGLSAAAAVVATVVLGLTMFTRHTATEPVDVSTTITPSPAPVMAVIPPEAPAPQVTTVAVRPPSQRVAQAPAPRVKQPEPQAPVTQPPTTPPTTQPPTTPPTTSPTTTPPIDTGTGGGTGTGTTPIDPGTGGGAGAKTGPGN
jgi:hypothetical protein